MELISLSNKKNETSVSADALSSVSKTIFSPQSHAVFRLFFCELFCYYYFCLFHYLSLMCSEKSHYCSHGCFMTAIHPFNANERWSYVCKWVIRWIFLIVYGIFLFQVKYLNMFYHFILVRGTASRLICICRGELWSYVSRLIDYSQFSWIWSWCIININTSVCVDCMCKLHLRFHGHWS